MDLRLDKWLWAARCFKTRSLAAQCIAKGRVQVNGQVAKASRHVQIGDRIAYRPEGSVPRELQVLALSAVRGPAAQAQALYLETPESVQRRAAAASACRLAPEPATTLVDGRPTKRNRRELEQHKAQWQRWSASLDD